MKTFILLAFLPAMVGLASVPRHVIERIPLTEGNGKVTFVDKYSDGTIDRTAVPQMITLQNRDYSVATNISRVVCVGMFRTNSFWCGVYEVRSVDGSIRTNLNFLPVEQKQLQIERKKKLGLLYSNRLAAAGIKLPKNIKLDNYEQIKPYLDKARKKQDAAKEGINLPANVSDSDLEKVVKLARAERTAGNKAGASAQLTGELKRLNISRIRTSLEAGDVVSEKVNARGQLVQKLTNGQTRVRDLKRIASVPIPLAKKTAVPVETDSNSEAVIGALVIAGAGAAALAAKKLK